MKRQALFLVLLLLLPCLLCSCLRVDGGLYNLCLETNFETSLPEGGTVLYRMLAPLGKGAVDYAVIQYPEESTITDHFPWNPIDEKAWRRINSMIEHIELYTSREEEEPIPSHLIPVQDMQYSTIGEFPSSHVFFVLSPSDMKIYVLIGYA